MAVEKGKAFFSEEKNQKTFACCCREASGWHKHLHLQKSFACFLQKRSPCFASPTPAFALMPSITKSTTAWRTASSSARPGGKIQSSNNAQPRTAANDTRTISSGGTLYQRP